MNIHMHSTLWVIILVFWTSSIGNYGQPIIQTPFPPDENHHSLSFLTYNTWGLPIWIPGSNQSSRYKKMPDSLIELNSDIICLQETFSVRLRKKILEIFPTKFYHYSDYSCNKRIIGPVKRDCHGGLMTWSKYPIIYEKFFEYNKKLYDNFEEKIGSKGFLFSTIITDKGLINIINTHLYAGQDQKASDIRLNQIKEMHQILDKEENYHKFLTVLAGDLNITHPQVAEKYDHFPPTDAYNYIKEQMHFRDSYPVLDSNSYTVDYRKNNFLSDDNPIQKLDYIFFHHPKQEDVCILKQGIALDTKTDLSDHFGWQTKIEW